RVARSQDGRGEEVWKVEAEHSKEPERAAEQGADSGDPTGSQSGGLVVAEDPTEMAVERSGCGVRRPHAFNCSRMGRPEKKTVHTAAFSSPGTARQGTTSTHVSRRLDRAPAGGSPSDVVLSAHSILRRGWRSRPVGLLEGCDVQLHHPQERIR